MNLVHDLTSRELATILAALRFWQKNALPLGVYAWPEFEEHFEQEKPLSLEEVDVLCIELNTATSATKLKQALIDAESLLQRVQDIADELPDVIHTCDEVFKQIDSSFEEPKGAQRS